MMISKSALAFLAAMAGIETALASRHSLRGGHIASSSTSSTSPPPFAPSAPVKTVIIGRDPLGKLGLCEGDCDSDDDCKGDLVCYQRSSNDDVPGCVTETVDMSRTDYCVHKKDLEGMSIRSATLSPFNVLQAASGSDLTTKETEAETTTTTSPTVAPTTTVHASTAPSDEPTVEPSAEPTVAPSNAPLAEPTAEPIVRISSSPLPAPTSSPSAVPTVVGSALLPLVYVRDQKPTDAKLGLCEGDCDSDDDCIGNLICFQRGRMDAVFGCKGGDVEDSLTDFCAPPRATLAAGPHSSGNSSNSNGNFDNSGNNNDGGGTSDWLPDAAGSNVGVASGVTRSPLAASSVSPSAVPSTVPSDASQAPLTAPSTVPSSMPSAVPSTVPSSTPSAAPSTVSSSVPSATPSSMPSATPSASASAAPSTPPSALPTLAASERPSVAPSLLASSAPSIAPSSVPRHPVVPKIVSSSNAYGGRSVIHLPRPDEMQVGDLLVLFLSRTDDPLPLHLAGWSTAATCFKQNNGQPWCITAEMCREPDGDYCKVFRRGNSRRNYDGHDLGTIVLTRVATEEDVDRDEYYYDLRGGQPGWAILAVVRGANTVDPVRSYSGVTCDKVRQSLFASTYGEADDLLLMHMGFDDTSDMERFQAPAGSQFVSFTKGPDEAGFLFAETLETSGQTGDRVTEGRGASDCKDVNIAIVFRAGN